ncbi:hypothetical protein Tco_1442206 [Tanacetum coccineum]
MSHELRSPIIEKLRNLEERYIHEGWVVFDNFMDLNYVQSLFHFVKFECLLEINEKVCPRFILEFYSQYRLSYSDEGQMFVEFVIQNQLFSCSLENFAQILNVPCEGVCAFTDRWRLDELTYGIPSDGPYQTNPPSIEDIILSIRIDREGQVRRIRHEEKINVLEYQILTYEIVSTLKPLEEIIWENLDNESYVLYDRVMNPLIAQLKRKPRRDHGTRRGYPSTSSSTFDQPSSSHLNDDDDDGNDEGNSSSSSHGFKKIKLTIIPPKKLFIDLNSDNENLSKPSPTTTSSSLTPPNAPSKTTSTKETTSSHENTSSSFQTKLQVSPPSTNEPTSPQPQNSFLQNLMDVPPQPLQSIPSLDMTLSRSPITPHENLSSPSSPLPPPPQPPIMGHPLYYNYHDYHGSTCICCFYNRNLHLNHRDEMNIMFAHLEYLLTTAFTTYFPPPP